MQNAIIFLISFGTVIGDAIVIALAAVLAIDVISHRRVGFSRRAVKLIGDNGLLLGFMTAFVAVIGSMYYSNVVLLPPCSLCWWQRVFMYPQAILFGIAYIIKDKKMDIYAIALSVCGGAVALYHYLLQFGVFPPTPCGLDGVSCSSITTIYYGYVTIPMMSLTAFSLLILFSAFHLRERHDFSLTQRIRNIIK